MREWVVATVDAHRFFVERSLAQNRHATLAEHPLRVSPDPPVVDIPIAGPS
jgi:hypothetical protein